MQNSRFELAEAWMRRERATFVKKNETPIYHRLWGNRVEVVCNTPGGVLYVYLKINLKHKEVKFLGDEFIRFC